MRRFFVLLLTCLLVFTNPSYADQDGGIGRIASCSSSGAVTGMLDFDPTSGGKDVQFDLTNPVCATVIAASYAATKIAINTMNCYCGGCKPRITPSPILDSIDLAKAGIKCTGQKGVGACCNSFYAALGSFTTSITALAIIYGVSQRTFNETKVCGSNWMVGNPNKYDLSTPGYKSTVNTKIDNCVHGSCDSGVSLDFSSKTYREWFYGGVEIEDNPYGARACLDPTQSGRFEASGGRKYAKQKYYLRGTTAGNFNCKKYLVLSGQSNGFHKGDMDEAYQCCLNRSKNYICIDYTNNDIADTTYSKKRTPTFCKSGENCAMMHPSYVDSNGTPFGQVQNGAVWFSAWNADSEIGLICAKSYSLCPYNFYVGGGTDACDYYKDGVWSESARRWSMITQSDIDSGDCSGKSEVRNVDCAFNEKAGKCRNYCQYLRHCVQTSPDNYVFQSSLDSPYFSQACIDFVGDSKNDVGYNTGILLGMQSHFTAPIAQCVKETLENLFYNRAGHSVCGTTNELPDQNGVCASGTYAQYGNYLFKKGSKVKDNSVFEMVQNTMSLVIKMAITLAVIFYGINLLLWKADLREKKDILVFLFKIALVMYFCVGTAWQDVFFRGFYDSSMVLANLLFKIETMQDPHQRDGCQFGKVSLSDGTQVSTETTDSGTTIVYPQYPAGKEYLAIWDTIDCKMMRYLGFGPQMSNANIASMVISSYFFGPIGIYFAMSVMIFGFFMISLAIRGLHIFISSAAAIILLIFMSPLVIPCGMFEKTKSIFNGWLGKLISYCLQPVILFAYIAVFVTVMDQTLIGSATFHGSPPTKSLSCSKICVDKDGDTVPWASGQAPPCDQEGQSYIDPLNDSVACLLNFNDFGSFHAFAVVGVVLPSLKNLFTGDVKQKILTILKAMIIMYLLYEFMDQISGIIEALVGTSGTGLPNNQVDPFKKLAEVREMVVAVSKRLERAGAKAARGSLGAIRDATNYAGNKGKSTDDVSGSDSTSKSSEGEDEGEGGAEGEDKGEGGTEEKDDG
ncbi:MAG: hypothetical protein FJX34_01320, partial [Alphaproteobacteria bacterium]|nr:hypothetical protein [Alphaproteobacteria bacterium]